MKRVDAVRKPEAIVTTNTSGIPIKDIAEGRSKGFKQHFLGTHFFNPPRYLKLLEIIPTGDTLPAVTRFMAWFGEFRLGQGYCPVQGHAQLHRQPGCLWDGCLRFELHP